MGLGGDGDCGIECVLIVCRRLGTDSARKDFLSMLVKKVESGEVDKEEMTAHVSTLV